MFKKLVQRLASLRSPAATGAPLATHHEGARAAILDEYVRKVPSAQNAIDLFKGDWWSAFPAEAGPLQAGHLPLFVDPRITWAMQALGGVSGRRILELGPLEGAHTYMLEQAGAASVLAVEASARAFLKCLISKEIMGLQRSRFVLGDFEDYLRVSDERFDAAIACGVLYHMKQPVELIHNLARVTDRVFIWTQYYIEDRIAKVPHTVKCMRGSHQAEYAGFRYTAHRYEYGEFLETTRFAGGSDMYSHWLERDHLLGALKHAGFGNIEIGEDDLEHSNGPCISLVASK